MCLLSHGLQVAEEPAFSPPYSDNFTTYGRPVQAKLVPLTSLASRDTSDTAVQEVAVAIPSSFRTFDNVPGFKAEL